MSAFTRIAESPDAMGGKPTIRGMRVTVGMIVGQRAESRGVVLRQRSAESHIGSPLRNHKPLILLDTSMSNSTCGNARRRRAG
jgi:hypothetical protein